MSPRIKLAVAAHIDDSSIFFPLFFHCLLSVLASWLRPPPPTPFLSLRSSHLPYSSSFCLLPLTLYAFFSFHPYSLCSSLLSDYRSPPFLFPVFLSSRLFALSLFFILFLPPLFLQFRHLRVIVSTCELLFKGVRVIQLQMTSLAVVPWLCIHTKAHRMQQVTASSPP